MVMLGFEVIQTRGWSDRPRANVESGRETTGDDARCDPLRDVDSWDEGDDVFDVPDISMVGDTSTRWSILGEQEREEVLGIRTPSH